MPLRFQLSERRSARRTTANAPQIRYCTGVMPANAGIHVSQNRRAHIRSPWVPAFAGTTLRIGRPALRYRPQPLRPSIEPNEIGEEVTFKQLHDLAPGFRGRHFTVFEVGNGGASLDQQDGIERRGLQEEPAKVDALVEAVMRNKLLPLQQGIELIQKAMPSLHTLFRNPQPAQHGSLARPGNPFVAVVGFGLD